MPPSDAEPAVICCCCGSFLCETPDESDGSDGSDCSDCNYDGNNCTYDGNSSYNSSDDRCRLRNCNNDRNETCSPCFVLPCSCVVCARCAAAPRRPPCIPHHHAHRSHHTPPTPPLRLQGSLAACTVCGRHRPAFCTATPCGHTMCVVCWQQTGQTGQTVRRCTTCYTALQTHVRLTLLRTRQLVCITLANGTPQPLQLAASVVPEPPRPAASSLWLQALTMATWLWPAHELQGQTSETRPSVWWRGW